MYMNVHIISSDVYLNGMAREQNGTYERGIMYGTERDGEKRNGLGTYSNVFIILVTVYGAERGIRRLIIEICT
jgi:hypothetical protein